MEDCVTLEVREGVADVRLNRPDKMNALTPAMFADLVATGERIKRDAGIHAVVLSGNGRAFCAGLDTGNFAKMAAGESGPAYGADRTSAGANLVQQAALVWREVPVPVIAAIHGFALGGGCQIALGADMRFLARDARIGLLEVRWGLVPDMGGCFLLPGLIRDDIARDLIFSGRSVGGDEALAIGFATRLCADPRDEALAYAAELGQKSPDALRAAKRLLNLARTADQAAILAAESAEQAALKGTANQREAVKAQMEKRAALYIAPPPAIL